MELTKVVDLKSGLSALLNEGIKIELLQLLEESKHFCQTCENNILILNLRFWVYKSSS